MTADQFKGVIAAYIAREQRLSDQYKADIEKHKQESMDALKMEYGDNHEATVNKAAEFIRAIGSQMGEGKAEEFSKWLDDTKFGDDPMVIRLFAAAAKLISEDTLHTGEGGEDDGRPVTDDGKPRLKFKSMGDK